MAPNVPATAELIRSVLALLAMRAEFDVACADQSRLEQQSDKECELTRQHRLTEFMRSEVANARYKLARNLVGAMSSTRHTKPWLHAFMVEEFAGQRVLIHEDGGRRYVYTSAEAWAEILRADTRLIPRERKMRAATDDDWLTLEAVLPQLLGYMTTPDILAQGKAATTAMNA